jgi:hypothetical protein
VVVVGEAPRESPLTCEGPGLATPRPTIANDPTVTETKGDVTVKNNAGHAGVVAVTGQVVGYWVPDMPDDAPPAINNALAARNTATITGVCPDCGGRMLWPNRVARRRAAREHRPLEAVLVHADNCVASDDALTWALDEWRRTR